MFWFSSINCNSLWVPISLGTLDKIRVGYNNCFRIIMGYGRRHSASTMFCDSRVKDFHSIKRTSAFSLLDRIAESESPKMKSIVCSEVFFTKSPISKSWKSLVFNI